MERSYKVEGGSFFGENQQSYLKKSQVVDGTKEKKGSRSVGSG